MNRELLESQWLQIREILGDKFPNLTEEDIRQINGRYDQLVAKLQQKYGYSREEAEDRIRNWNFDRFASTTKGTVREERFHHEDKVRREGDNNFLKWLLAIGIPLLLLGTYFYATRPETGPTVTREQTIIETPADRAISNNLRNFLVSQQNMAFEMQNVQIATRNGIVTLSGTVPNRETSNAIENAARSFSGVRQVVNNLETR